MKTAIILGVKHGGKEREIISGPDDASFSEQKAKFKEFLRSPTHKDYERVEIHYLNKGGHRHKKLSTPKAHAEKEKTMAAEQKKFEKHSEVRTGIHEELNAGEITFTRKNLSEKTKEELLAICQEIGCEANPHETKDDLIRSILKHKQSNE